MNNSSQFYDKFASKYDIMLPGGKRDKKLISFCKKIFVENKVSAILDCACGTGKHSIAFSNLGFNVVGCDLSVEMVKRARINAIASGLKINFVQADFKRLHNVFDKKFDCVICLTNSLIHELEEQGLLSALTSMYNVLSEKGIVIIEMTNIAKLIRDNTRIFPVHHHKEPNGDLNLFFYVLDFNPTKVTCNIVSFIERDGYPKFEVTSVDYNPISEHKISSLMFKVGFRSIKTYGSFEYEEFQNLESKNIIIVGRK